MVGRKTTTTKKKGVGQGKGGGRPCMLNETVSKSICECIELGMSYQHSCDCVRISYDTFLSWKNKARKAMESKSPSKFTKTEALYVKFLEDIKVAEAVGIQTNLMNIKKAASGDAENRPQWQAGAWLLERRHPEQFAKTEKIDQKTEHSGGVSINLTMTDCSKKEKEE